MTSTRCAVSLVQPDSMRVIGLRMTALDEFSSLSVDVLTVTQRPKLLALQYIELPVLASLIKQSSKMKPEKLGLLVKRLTTYKIHPTQLVVLVLKQNKTWVLICCSKSEMHGAAEAIRWLTLSASYIQSILVVLVRTEPKENLSSQSLALMLNGATSQQ